MTKIKQKTNAELISEWLKTNKPTVLNMGDTTPPTEQGSGWAERRKPLRLANSVDTFRFPAIQVRAAGDVL
jgi:1,2-phenylacetyl-CoA epoxidase catalytic subunit